MKKSWVITIGREFCSGGLEVAQKLSERMNIPYYDRDLIDQITDKTNLSREAIAEQDEKGVNKADRYAGRYRDDPSLILPVHTRIYEAQSDLIRLKAGEGPCIFVGRCADYILDECSNVIEVISIFIRADLEKRVARCMRLYSMSENEARKLILKTDKIRAKYYTSHTNREWGAVSNYTLIADTGVFGTDGAAVLIQAAVEERIRHDHILL